MILNVALGGSMIREIYKNIDVVSTERDHVYGTSLIKLFQYSKNQEILHCKMYQSLTTGIYVPGVFEHLKQKKHTLTVFLDEPLRYKPNKLLFDQYGMRIWIIGNDIYLKAEPHYLNKLCYSEFLEFAKDIQSRYIEQENEYVSQVRMYDPNWLIENFEPARKCFLFGSKSNLEKKRQQQFECLAFLFYMDYFKKMIR